MASSAEDETSDKSFYSNDHVSIAQNNNCMNNNSHENLNGLTFNYV